MLAAMEGNTALTKLWLERGADVNSFNDFGETVLSLAAHGGIYPGSRALGFWRLPRGASS
jgi:hypothetical protein